MVYYNNCSHTNCERDKREEKLWCKQCKKNWKNARNGKCKGCLIK